MRPPDARRDAPRAGRRSPGVAALGSPGPGARAAGADVRRHNLALVLAEVARAEPVSRAAVAAATGLTRGTVSSLVEALLAAGLVDELPAARGATGRPASPLQLNRSGPAGLGVEIGVDHVGACVVDLSGAVRALRSTPSAHRGAAPAAGLAAAAALAREAIAASGLAPAGVVLALPGVVGRDGVLQRAPNLPRWVDVAVAPALSARLDGLPVTAVNEADAAALAERWTGSAPPDAVVVSGGIGVGAGIVLGGELFRGAGGRAGELGHVVVDPDGPRCSCGGRGCLEQYAGREALLRAAGAADADDLVARCADGPAVAAAARALGVALAAAVHLLDVPAVVLGGLLARLGEPVRAGVEVELAARAPARPAVEVRSSVLDGDAAVRGAATAVVRELLRRP